MNIYLLKDDYYSETTVKKDKCKNNNCSDRSSLIKPIGLLLR